MAIGFPDRSRLPPIQYAGGNLGAVESVGTFLFHRSTLHIAEQRLYDLIREGLRWRRERILLPGCRSRDRAYELYKLVILDSPLFFHVGTRVGIVNGFSVELRPDYLINEREYNRQYDAVRRFLLNSRQQLHGRNGFDKLCILHDEILRRVYYCNTNSENEHNILGGIVDRRAVCEGIAKSFKVMCDINRVPCIAVFGHGVNLNTEGIEEDDEEENHAWNMVYLDGRWYCADVTFDLNLTDSAKDGVCRYDYFLRSASRLANSHTCADYIKVPATSDYHLYQLKGQYVNSMRDVKAVSKKLLYEGQSVVFELAPGFNVPPEDLADAVLHSSLASRFKSTRYSYNEEMRIFYASLS